MNARLLKTVIVTGSLLAGQAGSVHAASQEQQLAGEARNIVKRFAGTLKHALVSTMKAEGPQAAVGVCNVAAPEIAEKQSLASGWHVARTSLKLRNLANAPDAWEKKVLETFEKKKSEGASPGALEHFEVTERGGKKVFRYMKAIAAGKPCLTCHGESVNPDLYKKIKSLYPGDRAIGFKLGDLRGAFTLSRSLN